MSKDLTAENGTMSKDLAPENHNGVHDDRGSASDDSADDGVGGCGVRALQLLALRANFPIRAINGRDWQIIRHIYRQNEGEVQEEGMVDLIPTGPRHILMAVGLFGLDIYPSTTAVDNDGSGGVGDCIKVEWDLSVEDFDIEPEEYNQTICGGLGRMLEVTFLVIPNSIQAAVEVRLKLKDLDYIRSRVVWGKVKASSPDYGNKIVHLFSCERGRSLSVPSGSSWILPLTPSVIALSYRCRREVYIEVDLTVIAISDNQEEETNLKFTSLKFTHRVGSQQREVNGDQVEVKVTWNAEF